MIAFKNTIALTSVCLAALMFGLEISSVPVILPTLEKVLHGNFNDLQWVMNAYTIACTTILMATGTLADRFGRKQVFVISIIMFGIASLICGLSQTMPVLIISRFLQGMSGGAMLICQVAILSHQFTGSKERARAFGIWGIVFGAGLGFGPIIGGLIVAVLSWEWVFLIHAVLSVLTLLLILNGVQESKNPEAKRLDVLGIMTLSVSVFCLTFFITQGTTLGFHSTISITIITISVLSFIAFIITENKIQHPMFDFSVFRIRNFSGALLGSMGMNFSFWPFMIYLPIYFQSALQYDSITAGLSLLCYTLPTLVIPPFAERLSIRYQPGVVIPFGLFIIGLGFILMWFGSSAEHASWLTMLPGTLLAGTGLGLTNTPVTNTSTGSVASTRAGMASGIDMSARMISLAINIAIMGFILVSGVLSYLRSNLSVNLNALEWRSLSEKIAAGNITSIHQISPLDSSGSIAHAAITYGFSWIILYGAIGVWILAFFSLMSFSPWKNSVSK